MEEYARSHGDGPIRVSALNKTAFIQSMWLGQFDPAESVLDEARSLAQSCGDRAGLAEGLVTRCNVSTSKAEFDEAVKHLGQLIDVGRELNRSFETAFGLVHSANAWTYLARFDKAWPAAQAARDFAREHGDLMHLGHTLAFSIPWSLLSFGDTEAARQAAEEARAVSSQIGDNIGLTMATYALSSIARWGGDFAGALGYLEQGLAGARRLGMPWVIAMFLGALCGTTVEGNPSRFEETLPIHREALAVLENPMGVLGGGIAWAELGECGLLIGELKQARQLFEKALAVRTPFMYLQRPRYLMGLARVALQEGQPEAAHQHLAEARAFVDERKLQWHRAPLAFWEAETQIGLAQPAAAADCFRSAQSAAQAMGLRPLAERAAAGLAELRA